MENETLKSIKNRRSTRHYKSEQIREDQLQDLLDSGIRAPSADNSQPWHFTVIQDKNMINFISDQSKKEMLKSEDEKVIKFGKSLSHIFYYAPTLIIISGKEDVVSCQIDCSAAVENMLIAAESIGLGTVWVGFAQFFFSLEDEVRKLELPKQYKPLFAVAVGYKQDGIIKPIKRNADVINYIR